MNRDQKQRWYREPELQEEIFQREPQGQKLALQCGHYLIFKDAYSGEVGHAFQSKPAGHSGGSRPPIPVIPATLVGA